MAGGLTAALAALACPDSSHASIVTTYGNRSGGNIVAWGGTVTWGQDNVPQWNNVTGPWVDDRFNVTPDRFPNQNTRAVSQLNPTGGSIWDVRANPRTQAPIKICGRVPTQGGNGQPQFVYSGVLVR